MKILLPVIALLTLSGCENYEESRRAREGQIDDLKIQVLKRELARKDSCSCSGCPRPNDCAGAK